MIQETRLTNTRVRTRRLGSPWLATALAAALTFVIGPDAVQARAPQRRVTARVQAVVPLMASAGWTQGAADRTAVINALSDAVSHEARLRWQPSGGSVVLNANVRSLEIRHDVEGSLARCELSLVVTDGRGAVRATLETRRVMRSVRDDESIRREVLQGAITSAVRRLAAEL
ncbi:MAG: hypothetical protein Q8Q09_10535 [Deltaproteobacteria bacterium]|nr:hypothetical protein [Deltaproteobacteria bacterium]